MSSTALLRFDEGVQTSAWGWMTPGGKRTEADSRFEQVINGGDPVRSASAHSAGLSSLRKRSNDKRKHDKAYISIVSARLSLTIQLCVEKAGWMVRSANGTSLMPYSG